MSILYNSLVLGSSPLGYYRLGESSGTTANDISGNSFNGTYAASGVTYSQTGAIVGDADKCVLFNGSTGRMLMPSGINPSGWTAITVECWINLSNITFTSNPRLMANSHTDSDNNGFQLWINHSPTQFIFQVGNGTTRSQATYGITYAASTWYHFVGTYDGTTIRIYINGVQQATGSLTGGLGTSATQVGVGYNPTYNGDFLPGLVDEPAIYNSVLSASTILEHYNVGLQGNGGGNLYLATTGSVVLAQDINQALAVLQQPAGGQEKGKYFLTGNSYAIGANLGNYTSSLSRGSAPVSVSVDTADQAATNMNAPSTSLLTQAGFEVNASSTAIATTCQEGGNYTIQY